MWHKSQNMFFCSVLNWEVWQKGQNKSFVKVSKSKKQIWKFSFEPKTNENIFVILP